MSGIALPARNRLQLVSQCSCPLLTQRSRYLAAMMQLPYRPEYAAFRVCKRCGVFEPFQDLTDECCLVLYGVQCQFGQGDDDVKPCPTTTLTSLVRSF